MLSLPLLLSDRSLSLFQPHMGHDHTVADLAAFDEFAAVIAAVKSVLGHVFAISWWMSGDVVVGSTEKLVVGWQRGRGEGQRSRRSWNLWTPFRGRLNNCRQFLDAFDVA